MEKLRIKALLWQNNLKLNLQIKFTISGRDQKVMLASFVPENCQCNQIFLHCIVVGIRRKEQNSIDDAPLPYLSARSKWFALALVIPSIDMEMEIGYVYHLCGILNG